MIAFFSDVRSRTARRLVVGVVGVVLVGGLVSTARAQEVPDTSRAQPAGVEPAGLDSLPSGDLAPPARPTDSTTVAADTGDTERAYVNADSLSALRQGGERIQELFGNVFVRQDTTRLRSEYARRYLERDELLFVEDVVIYERGDTLRADTVRYDRTTEVGHARGNVRLTNGDVRVRSDRGTYYAEEKRSVFPDSVVLVDSNRVLRAHHGTYWSDEERAEFGGGVRLTEPRTTIVSDSLTYYRDRERSVAQGDVFITRRGDETAGADTTARTYLFGNRADNRERRRYSRVQGQALLVQIRTDSTGAPTDTLVVRARRLEAFRTDTHRRLIAVESVRVWQPDLAAVADSLVYDRVVAPTPDSAADQGVPIDTTRPPPDSIAVIARKNPPTPASPPQRPAATDSLAEEGETEREETRDTGSRPLPDTTARPPSTGTSSPLDSLARAGTASPPDSTRQWTTPTARSDSALPLEEIRLFRNPMTWFERSQVWGDSIRVRVRNRSPDTIFVRGSAFAAQRDSVLDRIQQLKARDIVAFFRGDSLRRILARPNAQAIRFMATEEGKLNGAAQTSGDHIMLRFKQGDVRRISVVGGVKTTYYRENKNIPDPFELEGFRWTPDRRPTRSGLLRDERVRRHLELEGVPRRRPIARQDPHPSPSQSPARQPDSTAARPSRPGRLPSTIPEPVRQRLTGSGSQDADSLQTPPSPPPDSIPPPRRPVAPPDTSETNPNSDP